MLQQGKLKMKTDGKKISVEMGTLPTGVIIGSVEIVDCEFDENLQYYKYKLKNPKRYKTHIEPDNQAQPCFFFPFGRFE